MLFSSRTFDPPREAEELPRTQFGQAELLIIADAVAAIAPDWSVKLSRLSADEVDLIIFPKCADDEVRPTFVIYQDRNQVHVDQVKWDVCVPIGVYPDLAEATHAMVQKLTIPVRSPPASHVEWY